MQAAIDIGSNTVLLLVGCVEGEKVHVEYEEQHAPRLGKGVDAQKNLSSNSVERVVEVLNSYKYTLESRFPTVDGVTVTATSAVRDAANRQEFVDRVKDETGFSVETLSGDEEAAYTFYGAKSTLKEVADEVCVLDIGGGSTEVATGSEARLEVYHSYDVGSVRFTERYLTDDPPKAEQLSACRNAIEEAFLSYGMSLPSQAQLIGVAGTVTSLAHINVGLKTYSPQGINGTRLSTKEVKKWIDKFQTLTSEQLLQRYPTILEGRADVILGGLLILHGFMEYGDFSGIIVSTGGIRHGALLKSR